MDRTRVKGDDLTVGDIEPEGLPVIAGPGISDTTSTESVMPLHQYSTLLRASLAQGFSHALHDAGFEGQVTRKIHPADQSTHGRRSS